MFTRSPPPSRSWSRNTSVAVIAPSRLTSTIWRCSARCSEVNGASSITPALLTRTFAPPSSLCTRPAAATIESRSVTSASIAIVPPPSSAASAWMRSARRAKSARWWPPAASARAVASPMPDDAPVMTATRPAFWSVLMVSRDKLYPPTPSHTPEQAHDASQHLDLLAADRLHRLVLGLQADVVGFLEEALHGRLLPQQRHHDLAVARGVLGAHHDQVALHDADVLHRVPAHAQQVLAAVPARGLRDGDVLLDVLFRQHRLAGRHRAEQRQRLGTHDAAHAVHRAAHGVADRAVQQLDGPGLGRVPAQQADPLQVR